VFARQLYNIARSEPHFRAAEIEQRVKVTEPQPAVEAVSLSAVEPVSVSLASDLVTEKVEQPEPVERVESPHALAELESPEPSSTQEWVDDIEGADLREGEVDTYVEEEGWELEQVERVLTGTLPTTYSRPRTAASSLRAALHSIPVVLAGTGSRLNSPKTRRAFVALMLSVVAIAAGAMIVYLLSSAKSYVSQAKTSTATSQALPNTVQSEQAPPATISVHSPATPQLAPTSAPAARPSVAPQSSPSPAENAPATLKEQTAESAADVQHEEQALRVVFDRWLTATNNRDVDSQMDLYTDEIDTFYRSRHTSLDDVREHKAMVYNRASSIDMRASEPEIKIDDGGQKATMRFRKEWVIKGKSSSRGRAMQELRLAKTEEGWKITGERNVSGNGG
jgi:ketosteroid isomerase-like protein